MEDRSNKYNEIGNYIWQRKLGSGANAQVFLANNSRDGRRVAIKCFRGKQAVCQGRLEANILSGIDHPAVPRFCEVFCQGEDLNLVMEYVPGMNLMEKILREGKLSWKESAEIGIQLCQVLSELHRKGIVYRDLKPSNVIVTPIGQIKLIDFGAAMWQREHVKEHVGTVGFAPPEQFQRGRTLNAQADIYALGVTMHYMLTGVHPSEVGERFFPLKQYGVGIPRSGERILKKCLQPDLTQRYRFCAEVLQDLKNPPANHKIKNLVIVQTAISIQ